MKIAVTLRQVPAKDAALRLDWSSGSLREAESVFELNEADGYALEEALRMKDLHGSEVVTISIGPDRVAQVIREALAKGADRGIHVIDEEYRAREPLHLASMMARVLGQENFDIVVSGAQSDDHGFGQTAIMLAELLNVPHVTLAIEMCFAGFSLRVKRELEAGLSQWISLPLPGLVTVNSSVNRPRYANMRGMMAAKKKPIITLQADEIMPAPMTTSQRLVKLLQPRTDKHGEIIENSEPNEAAVWLHDKFSKAIDA